MNECSDYKKQQGEMEQQLALAVNLPLRLGVKSNGIGDTIAQMNKFGALGGVHR